MGIGQFWGTLIRKLREEQGIAQRTLAMNANVCRNTLVRIENGKTAPGIEDMERLFDCLGYDLDALERDNHKQSRQKRIAVAVNNIEDSKFLVRLMV